MPTQNLSPRLRMFPIAVRILFCCLVPSYHCAVASNDFVLNLQSRDTGKPISLYSFERFGFTETGRYSIQASASFSVLFPTAELEYHTISKYVPSLFSLLVCTTEQHNEIHGPNFEEVFTDYCLGIPSGAFNKFSESHCRAHQFQNATLESGFYTVNSVLNITNAPVPERGVLHFAVTNCYLDSALLTPMPVTIQGSYEFVNPGQWYLSTQDEPNATIYSVTAILWAIVSVLWWIGVMKMRRTVDMSLHKIMGIYPVAKVMLTIHAAASWYVLEKGLGTHKSPRSFVFPLYMALRLIYLAAFALSLLLIGKGWKLSRDNLHSIENRNVVFMTFIFAITTFALGVWGTYEGQSSSFASFIFLAMAYVVILYSIWYSATQNIIALKIHLRAIALFGIDPKSTPIYQTLIMFVRFRAFFFLYLVCTALTDLTLTSLFSAYPWLKNLADELVEGVAALFVGTSFRPRELNCVLQRVDQNGNVIPATTSAAAPPPNENSEQGETTELREWRSGMELPSNPRSDMLFSTSSRYRITPQQPTTVMPSDSRVEMVTIVNPGESEPSSLGCRISNERECNETKR